MTSTACLRELIVPPRASSSADPCLSHPGGPLDFVLEPHYIACVPSNSPIMSHCLPLNIFIPNSWSGCLAKIVSKCCPQPPLGEGGRPGALVELQRVRHDWAINIFTFTFSQAILLELFLRSPWSLHLQLHLQETFHQITEEFVRRVGWLLGTFVYWLPIKS